jgi:hypothetical protein
MGKLAVLTRDSSYSCMDNPVILWSFFMWSTIPSSLREPKNACFNRDIYRDRWNNMFLPAIRKNTKEPVAIIMDNCYGRDPSCVASTAQVEIIFFIPNCTSIYPPLDQGIISTLKILSWWEVLSSFPAAYDCVRKIRKATKSSQNRFDLQS